MDLLNLGITIVRQAILIVRKTFWLVYEIVVPVILIPFLIWLAIMKICYWPWRRRMREEIIQLYGDQPIPEYLQDFCFNTPWWKL
jgi:hypothetical protein